MTSRSSISLAGLVVLFFGGLLMATVAAKSIQEAKEDAKAAKCRDNLHYLAIGIHEFHDAHNKLPPFTLSDNEFHGSWALAITPYLEDEKTFNEFAQDETAASETNLPIVCSYRNEIWQCPTRRAGETYDFPKDWKTNGTETTFEDAMPTDYAAVHTAGEEMWNDQANGIIVNPRTSIREGDKLPAMAISFVDCIDGLSNTAMFGEKHMHKSWIGQPVTKGGKDGLDIPLLVAAKGPQSIRLATDLSAFGTIRLATGPDEDDALAIHMFGSWHKRITIFASADASVRDLPFFADPVTLRFYTQRNDRMSIALPGKNNFDDK